MRLAVTGGFGFLGWHISCRLRALHGITPMRLGRSDFADIERLSLRLSEVDAVIHIAGINRAATDDIVERGNVEIAQRLAGAIGRSAKPVHVVFANSVQANADTAYGRGKRRAAAVLAAAVSRTGGQFADVLLPNLFGEHGRPGYNSFVATFAHEVVRGQASTVIADRDVALLHAQQAAAELIDTVGSATRLVVEGQPIRISKVLEIFEEFHSLYGGRGEIPDISDSIRRDLFNTYRSVSFPGMWPRFPQVHADDRGRLFETTRTHGSFGMSFMSTTRPGQIRGEHYHLHKVERFCVIRGEAQISLRRLFHDDVITFDVSGDEPAYIDMPTLWVHNIRNVGDTELVTTFWADQLLDPGMPDQFAESVTQEGAA